VKRELAERAFLYAVGIVLATLFAWWCIRNLPRGGVTRRGPTLSLGDALHELIHGHAAAPDPPRPWHVAVRNAAGVTFAIVAGAQLLALAVALLLAQLRRATIWVSRVAPALLVVWVGLWLAYFVAFKWSVTPITGYCDLFWPPHGKHACGGPVQWTWHLVLPWVTLALAPAALYARRIRYGIDSAGNALAFRRDVAAPLVQGIARDFGPLVGVSLLIETTFGLPGLGWLLYSSIERLVAAGVFSVLVAAAILSAAVKLPLDALWLWLRHGGGGGGPGGESTTSSSTTVRRAGAAGGGAAGRAA
jgi:hypothetical protein